jgi:hypothetical protein
MAVQNLISAALTPEDIAEITQKLGEVKSKLNFLVTLEPNEKNEFVKVGNTYAPFIEKAYNVIIDHPEIMSSVFGLTEYKKDYQLGKDLTPIHDQVKELAEALQNTIFAVNSDTMSESLEIYAAVQQNKDKVPGMNTVAAEMQAFFKKAKKAKTQPPQ